MRASTVSASGSQDVAIPETCLSYAVDWEATAKMYYDPGRVSGPPEDCYPPEGECEITELTFEVHEDGSGLEVMDQKVRALVSEFLNQEKIEEALWENYQDRSYEP